MRLEDWPFLGLYDPPPLIRTRGHVFVASGKPKAVRAKQKAWQEQHQCSQP